MKKLKLPSERMMPILGQGTWGMGEDPKKRSEEIEALRVGIEQGMSLIDTAEIYGNGKTEELVGEAIEDRRKEVYLVSKVSPQHATRKGTIEACEKSLQRLKTNYLDLYLLHWRGSVPIEETFDAFHYLKRQGKILDYGVSNFDLDDMIEATKLSRAEVVTNQVLYNLMHRGIELDLLPWCQEHKIPIMAYTPIQQGQLLQHPMIKSIASHHAVTPAQVALAWVLTRPGVNAIPKAGKVEHVRENFDALKVKLTNEDLRELDKAFPPPIKKIPLEVL